MADRKSQIGGTWREPLAARSRRPMYGTVPVFHGSIIPFFQCSIPEAPSPAAEHPNMRNKPNFPEPSVRNKPNLRGPSVRNKANWGQAKWGLYPVREKG